MYLHPYLHMLLFKHMEVFKKFMKYLVNNIKNLLSSFFRRKKTIIIINVNSTDININNNSIINIFFR